MGVGSQPTPSRMVRISPPLPTSPWARAHTTPSTCKVARARTSTEQAYTRTRATREEQGRDSRVRHWARLRHTSDDAGSGRATTPGDHAANLGATMLDTCYTRLRRPTSRRRTRHAVHLESTLLLSIQNALALISSLYYTHAPQLLTRRRQRVHHTSTFPHQVPVVSWSCFKSPRLFGEEVLLPYGLVNNCLLVPNICLPISFLVLNKNPRMLGPNNPTVS